MAWKIRDFKCEKCTEDFEAMASDEEAPQCPKCADSEWVVRGGPTSPARHKIMGDNSASTTPKGGGGGGFKRDKR
jgi:hypothetical protein